ncbi:MAG: MaoC family dehydratase N-terminal domain-containing protein [Desulfobacterales bacterium]|nr:MaoC family dehydratase N-terminal domain-containing protein [Desulfobacterales bacterium]
MKKTEASMAEGVITPELIEEMKNNRGLKLRVGNAVFNEYATRDNIRKFADGVGDINPLFRDEEYAGKSRYGCIIAPPSFVFSVLAGIQFGWRGLAGYHSASDMEFYAAIKEGDRVRPEETYLDFEGPKESKFAEKTIFDYFENKYFGPKDDLVAKVKRLIIRAERKKTREKGKYSNIEIPHPWTMEELEKIEEEVLAEEIRGSTPRYWEDVTVGQQLPQLVKGPLGYTDMVAAVVAGLAPARLAAHGVALREYRRKPAWAFRDPMTKALEPIFSVHYSLEAAKAMGLPYPYDVGTQRHSWFIQCLTDWMGDDGWIKRCYAEYRRFVYLSDVIRIQGEVTEKFIDDEGEYCVRIKASSISQRGENVMPGEATISLPSKEKNVWPTDRRI